MPMDCRRRRRTLRDASLERVAGMPATVYAERSSEKGRMRSFVALLQDGESNLSSDEARGLFQIWALSHIYLHVCMLRSSGSDMRCEDGSVDVSSTALRRFVISKES